MSAPVTAPPIEGVSERNLDLAFDLFEAALDDPLLLADVPPRATLVLMPNWDPELFAANIEIGLAALRRGENVYFRHATARPRSTDTQ